MQRNLFTLICLLGLIPLFSQTSFEGKYLKLKTPELDQRFEKYQLFEMDAATLQTYASQHPEEAMISLKTGPELQWEISLSAVDIRQDDYQLVVQTARGRTTRPRTANKTYRGWTVGEGTGPVRLTLDKDFIYGLITQHDKTYFIEPAWVLDPTVEKGIYLVYKEEDVIDQQHTCGTDHEHAEEHQPFNKPMTAPEATRMMACLQVPYALAADFSMFQVFGSVAATENFMVGVLNNVQTNYDNEFNNEIDFEVAGFFISSCSSCDPWTSSNNAGTLLNSFTNWGNNGGFGFSYSLASLWTNRNLSGSTIGVAWVGGLCSNLRYNVVQRFSTNASLLRVLLAHEIGHNFNANHDNPSTPFIMAPSVNTSTQWSTASQNSINGLINFLSGQPGCFLQCTGALPPEAIIQAPVTHVCPGSIVPFIDGSLNNPTSWDWDFQGGQPPSSTQQNPIVFYPDEGFFTVSMTVENSVGVDVAVLNTDIRVDQDGTKYLLYETFENGLGSWTAVNPDNSTTWEVREVGGTQYGRRAAYMNNFDYNASGQTDGLLSPTLSFAGESDLTFQMDYAYRRYNAQFSEQLIISISTDGGFSYDQLFIGQETGGGTFATSFDSQTAFTPNTPSNWCYAGSFGPGCITLDLSDYAGEDNVRIKVDNVNDFGNNMYIDNIRITGNCQPTNPPIASFISDVSDGCAPLSVQFEDLSFGTVDNWEWSFPGGTPSSSFDPNPVVIYNVPGIYDVSLTVYNSAGADDVTLPAYITVEGPPTPDFISEPQGLTVEFTDLSINASSISWNFGDGTQSNEPAPSHTYDSGGSYDVTLYSTNNCGTDSLTQTITLDDPVTAGFTADTIQGCPDLLVTYTDTTSGDVVSWQWDFEGGNPATDTVQNPVVTYENSGLFNTTLIVTTSTGATDTLTQNNYITIDSLPDASFDLQYTPGETVVDFTSTVSHADSLYWDFGDGNSSSQENPTHDYGTDGTYEITLIAVSECGSDTTSQSIDVVTLPNAGFSTNTIEGCIPLTVEAQDTSSNNTDSLLWLATGATPDSSASTSPSFTYDTSGIYTLILIATNEAGSDTSSLMITVNDGPVAAFDFDYTIGQTTVSFNNLSTNANTYNWNFGNGNTSSEENPDFDFGTDGIYTATLIASNTCGDDTTSQQIEIITLPNADFSLASADGCAPFEVSPQENASENTDSWQWIANGATPDQADVPDPTFTYDTPGDYTISLIVSNEAGSDTASVMITVNDGPVAAFDFDYTIGQTTVSFNNLSTNAESYSWNFGNGNTSSEENPNFDFGTDGIYTATLIASNTCGDDTTSQQIEIITLPNADFSLASADGCTPFEVSPQENASENTDSWQWIANGATPDQADVPDPTFIYDTPGDYTISLIVSNEAGSDTASVMITVNDGPVAAFDFDYTIGQTTVSFNNLSTNAETYSWNFGNGNTSSEENPDFDFGTDGIYTATLIASNTCGDDTTSQQIEIITLPSADFSLASDNGCAPFEVSPQENASENTDSWQWIANGATPDQADVPDPTFTYDTPGDYTISLIVSNEAGSDTASVMITVNDGPVAAFAFDYTIGETTVSFNNLSTNAETYSWNFGNGNTSSEENPAFDFGTDGIYTATLIASNTCGDDTTSQQIEIITLPSADFSLASDNGCAPFEVSPQENASENTDSWQWIATGATPDQADVPDPTFTYDTPGDYTISLIVSNEAGSDTASVMITVNDGPVAAFDFDYTIGETTVSFNNLSTNAETYSWNFGNGNTSSEENPNFDFGTDGIYTATLIASNTCGGDTTSQQIEIITLPNADFSLASDNGCAPFEVSPQENASENTDSWQWIATGATPASSNSSDPTFVYNTPGSYTLALIASNEAGSDTAYMDVTVLDNPTAAFTTQVNGLMVSFTNNSIDATAYQWDFGDGTFSTEENPSHAFPGLGSYIVELIAENACGTTLVTDTVVISLAAPIADFTVENGIGCGPLEVNFINTSVNGETYEWTFEGGSPATSTEKNPTIVFNSPGTYSVTLIAINPAGSGALTQMDIIVVNSGPISDFIFLADGNMVDFFNNSQNADQYLWLFGDGESSTEENPSHTYMSSDNYEVMLISSNECGADTSVQTVMLEVTAPEPVIEVQDATNGCIPFSATFMGTSAGGEADTYLWTFEGGTPATSTEQNPTVIYNQAGIFDVSLTMTNSIGSATTEELGLINVLTAPEAFITADQVSAFEFSFSSNATGGELTYNWDFGDGNTSEEANPTHSYEMEGSFLVELTVSNRCGEIVVTQEVIIVVDNTSNENWIDQLNLYPNPNQGTFTLEIRASPEERIEARIYNVVGQLVDQLDHDFHTGYWTHTYYKNQLASGVYILELSAGTRSVYRRIVVE